MCSCSLINLLNPSTSLGDGGYAVFAGLSRPSGIGIDSIGNLCITQSRDGRLRFVNASSSIISRLTTSEWKYSGDDGPSTSASLTVPHGCAFDASNNIIIADKGNRRIRRISRATGVITTIAGTYDSIGDGAMATEANLARPMDVVVSSAGDLYIADRFN